MIFSSLVRVKLGLLKISIFALVGDLAYIHDIWVANLDDEFFAQSFERKNLRAHTLNRLVTVEKKKKRRSEGLEK